MDSETDSHFCYFYIKQPIQAIICLVYLLIGVALLVIAVNQYRISLIKNCINSNIKLTYVCLFLSLLCTDILRQCFWVRLSCLSQCSIISTTVMIHHKSYIWQVSTNRSYNLSLYSHCRLLFCWFPQIGTTYFTQDSECNHDIQTNCQK